MNIRQLLVLVCTCSTLIACSSQQKEQWAHNPAAKGGLYPHLFSTQDTLYMSWITTNIDGTNSLQYASYDGHRWSPASSVASDSTWFVNWADFPSVIANNNGPLAVHWLNKRSGGTYAYNVNISTLSKDDEWKSPIIPHMDGTATEHGFVSMIPWDHDSFLAVWLDGRQTADRSDEEYYDIDYAMTLRGALISSAGDIEKRFLIDDSVCDCCQTSLVKTGSQAWVAYRNRTENEIRDIYISRFDGNRWTKSKAIYDDQWKVGACPVNGPKLAAQDSIVSIVWHTGAQGNPTTKFAYSTDRGASFNKPHVLNKGVSLGRVDAAIDGKTTYFSWMEKAERMAELKLSSFNIDTRQKRSWTVAELNESRKTGFPQMEKLNDALYFAWTQQDSSGSKVVTRQWPLNL